MKTLEKVNPKVSVSASRVKKLSVLAVFLSSDKSGLPQYLKKWKENDFLDFLNTFSNYWTNTDKSSKLTNRNTFQKIKNVNS